MDLNNIIPGLYEESSLKMGDKHRESITKETKHDAYNFIIESLGERQKLVYTYLAEKFKNGASAKEIAVAMFQEGLVASPERNSVHPRLNEMVELGLVKVIGKKTCQYTDRKVAIYKN